MKKSVLLLLTGVLALSMTACGKSAENTAGAESTTKKETQIVTVQNAEKKDIEVEFPTNLERIVVLNHQTMDFLDAVGMADKVVGYVKDSSAPQHLQKYVEDDKIVDVGGMKDPDMEAIMSLEPDAIFISDRTQKMYDEFSKIAPTMAAYVDYSMGFMEGYKALADKHAQIFGVKDEVTSIIEGYEDRIAAIDEFAGDQTCLLGIFAGGINTLGNTGRASIVVNEMGFNNLAGGDDVNHGNISSYEAWLEMNPDWMFVLDKDTAVGTEAVSAKEQMEVNNPVIAQTDAFKNGQIVYLEPGTSWYTADGGITALDQMITCIEEAVGLK